MEDAHITLPSLNTIFPSLRDLGVNPRMSLFAVFDGHGGKNSC